MIIYEPNKHFLKDIGHLAKSWTMVKIFRSVLAIGVYCLVVSFALKFALDYGYIDEFRGLSSNIFSFLGIVLSILLVFRTNSAYDRWWEGRKQWGALVNHCRNLAVVSHATFPPDDRKSREYLATHISNFCIAFKEHLRKGPKLEELINLSEKEKAIYEQKDHVPNHISYEIHQLVHAAHQNGSITLGDYLHHKPHLQALLDILGACERIKKTPIPFSYAVYIKIFILAYGVLLPFALYPSFGLWTPLIVMFVFFAFMGVELMAEEIEDPFGLDCNDLPTGDISHTIKRNVHEILGVKKSKLKGVDRQLYEKVF